MKTILEGLKIIAKYTPDTDFAAEHDIIYCGECDEMNMSDEDKKKMEDLGWFIDEEYNCWCSFC